MGWLRRRSNKPGTLRAAESDDAKYLRDWIASRSGIEHRFSCHAPGRTY